MAQMSINTARAGGLFPGWGGGGELVILPKQPEHLVDQLTIATDDQKLWFIPIGDLEDIVATSVMNVGDNSPATGTPHPPTFIHPR
jgi:hypothetical protein